jgi:outer membrane protein TolC
MQRLIFCLPLIFLVSSLVLAQECANPPSCFLPKHLTLRDAIVLALRNNPQIRSAELQRIIDKFSFEVARNQFWPQYSFDTSATYSNGTKPYYSTNPKATLATPYGSQIDLGFMDQVNAGRETAAFVQVTQPLLRGFGPTVARAGYLNAYDQAIINCFTFKDTLMTTITNVIQAYYRLVQDFNNQKVNQASLDEAYKLLRATQIRIKAGKVAGAEIVQQQAQIATTKMALTRDCNTIAQDYRSLLLLLGLDPRARLEIEKRIGVYVSPLPNEQEAIAIALCKNLDYQRALLQLKQLELALTVAKNEQQWKLDLIGRAQQEVIRNKNFATVNLNQIDAIGNDRPGGDRTLVINLNIPIHDLNRKQTLVRARVVVQQFKIALENQRQQLIANVLNALQALSAQSCQLGLATDAVKFSAQSLDIAQKKFLYGRTSMFEVTSLQRNLMTQQIGLISEQIAYLNNEASFEKLLGMTLEKWHIKICG